MKGYWKDPYATKAVLDTNGYRTGDLGYMDREGFFFITARKDSLLKVGGHRLNPRETEDAIWATGMVIEACVVGAPDRLLGNRLVAFAAPARDGCTPDEILAGCAMHLPRHKMPQNLRLFRALPKNTNGKIDREKLVQMLSRDPEYVTSR